MAKRIGQQAVVVGAGMGGLATARALSECFERVLVLESDVLPREVVDRAGVPQGKHVHILLAGGQRALGELLPGFEQQLGSAAAVPLRIGFDLRLERPRYDPFPKRDLGFDAYALSRSLIESSVRRLAQAVPNIEIRDHCRVQEFLARPDGSAVTGVRCVGGRGTSETLETDMVVDASGRGNLTLDLLTASGRARPDETTVGVDVAYSTAIFAIPDDAPSDWKGVFTFPDAPKSSRGGLLAPLEGRRWILTVAGRDQATPPGDADGFLAFARQLRTSTIYEAIKDAKRLSEIARFRFPDSRYRHFDRLASFPRGLLPIGDTICRFNPIYGQGMSVAAQQAHALARLLAVRAAEADPLEGLAPPFFAQASALIDTPWANAAIPDFIYPDTRGTRPENFEQLLKLGAALTELAARDADVHTLTAEVQHLLKPRSVYQDPGLVSRMLAIMAER